MASAHAANGATAKQVHPRPPNQRMNLTARTLHGSGKPHHGARADSLSGSGGRAAGYSLMR